MTTRTSYVIAPDGKVLMSYTDGNFAQHVSQVAGGGAGLEVRLASAQAAR
jgi:hypothetical protein